MVLPLPGRHHRTTYVCVVIIMSLKSLEVNVHQIFCVRGPCLRHCVLIKPPLQLAHRRAVYLRRGVSVSNALIMQQYASARHELEQTR